MGGEQGQGIAEGTSRYYLARREYYRGGGMATTMTSKGQVTIPKAVRERLGLRPGSKVEFRQSENGDVVISPVANVPASNIRSFVGHLKTDMTTDEIMAFLRGDD